ncbi:MAG: ThuA domain-containing protein, partial [Verrucomicrobiota bacterium]
MKRFVPLISVLSAAAVIFPIVAQDQKAKSKPLKALLVAGGCCHDYAGQHKALYEGIQARANVQVDVFWTDDKSVNPPLPLYDDRNWADGYDVIIHDECAAGNKDKAVLKNILDAHQTVPAVHLHCAMHSFRIGNDDWFKHIGLKSTGHGPQVPIKIEFVDETHPITESLENWETGKEELYNNVELHTAQPLAMGTQTFERNGETKEAAAIVVWTNEASGAKSFSTSLGHNTFTVEDDRYLNLVTRGLLWATDKLNDDYLGVPFEGENKITFVPKKEAPKPAPPKTAEAPKDATLVTMTASTEETGKSNFAWRAVDGDPKTRWCASSSKKPEWLQLAFDEPMDVDSVEILWEQRQQWYQYTIQTSVDGESWKMAADKSKNETGGDTNDTINAKGIKFLKVTVLKQEKDLWSSLWELQLKGPKIKSIFPKLDEKTAARLKDVDKLAKSGNIKPEIVELTPDERKKILDNVKVPEGFDVSIFSSWQAANYPVYVAASPSGDLYVSSDGNGSLGREPDRGRVLRLRDKDGDGTADEVTEFIPNIDSPRGLIWDQDRLYLLHPPHISVFYDRDGDGVSEDSERLISDIAFGFKDRPADHTTNSLEIGIDGWIYIAGGDFGFLKATGTDGRQLQHRNGGVIRFRPDGSGLEIFATGTRNILGVPVSPLLDAFARIMKEGRDVFNPFKKNHSY